MKSLEAEHGVIGAMLIQPHLIDVLSDDLSPDAFFHAENRELYSLILSLHAEDKPVDIITLDEHKPKLDTGHVTIALAGEIQSNTPGAANAKAYAKIVRDRAVARQIARIGAQISEIANDTTEIEDRISQTQALALSLDTSGSDGECQMVGDILLGHSYELERRFERTQDGVKVDGLSTGIADLDQKLGGLKAGQMIVLAGRPAMGKAQPLNAKVLLESGSFVRMGDISMGDKLASVDGSFSQVVGIYPQGVRPVYRVALTDGRVVEADADHLWEINSSKWCGSKTVTTMELKKILTRKRYHHRVTLAEHNGDFGSQWGVGVDPWLLGFLIGDGALTHSTLRFSTPEDYILSRVEASSGIKPKHVSCYDYSLTTQRGQPNKLLDVMKGVGMMGLKSHERFVPEPVFSSNKVTRQEVLAGLLESDGWVEKTGSVMFASSSRQLRDDVVALVESLGGSCTSRVKGNCGYTVESGEKKLCRDSYIACIKLNSLREFIRSPRILKNIRERYRTDQPYVASIDFVRNDETVCIKVSHPSGLYLTDGYVVTHNTTLAMNIATDAAINQKKKVLVISLEMSKAQLMDRLLAAVGGIPLQAVKDGTVISEYGGLMNLAAYKLKSADIAVSDVPVMTMSRIRSIARRQKHRLGGMDLIVVDYLGLVEGDGNGRVEDVTTMSRQIKLLARELGCPVLILSQLNRSCESRPDKRPVLSDLRESGAIEQDADIAIFVYRDEVYYPDATDNKGIAEVLIRKNRDGEIGVVRTLFQGDKSRFVPIAPEYLVQNTVEAGF